MILKHTGILAPMALAVMTLPLAGPIHADVETVDVTINDNDALSTAPIAKSPAYAAIGQGMASYYGNEFAGRPTASGETFDPSALTAAHRTLPFGTEVQVTNELTGASVVVTINDRGPFHGNRVIDLSEAAARKIGLVRRGSGMVELAVLTPDA
ncbi:septal ring lytic transglycosylase RlpA family protein [Novosphingobium malaysiense]|nr:septal ring lytic transglycosylase RlpA family protein [Novosphingobium malaysiense]